MNGLLLATALVPTNGHAFLVAFASSFMANLGGELHVIISERSFEPIPGKDRIEAFRKQFIDHPHVFFHLHSDDDAPQSDDGTQTFWDYWKHTITSLSQRDTFRWVFGSESYCSVMADQLGAQYMPCDPQRTTFNITGTDVRKKLPYSIHNVMPAFRPHVQTKFTLFGAESVGKTTMTKYLSDKFPEAVMLQEWARPYLEECGAEVTDSKMDNITLGQYALQTSTYNTTERALIFQDTDLLSTIGYYRLFGSSPNHRIADLFRKSQSNLYIVMNSTIPFEADPLRYGDGVRESDDQYWIDLLEEFNCEYYYVKSTDLKEQREEVSRVVDTFITTRYASINKFIRD